MFSDGCRTAVFVLLDRVYCLASIRTDSVPMPFFVHLCIETAGICAANTITVTVLVLRE